jgi:endonuclease-3
LPEDGIEGVLGRLEAQYEEPPAMPRFAPMDELVSCILSQHTSDANSFPAFARLKEAFPSWEDLVAAGPERLAPVIWNAGLANQKSKTILAALNRIQELNGDYSLDNLRGMAPEDASRWLQQLPGIGPKTAAIVLCFSFGMDVLPVDTHVFRVAWRLGLVSRKIGEAKAHAALQAQTPPGLSYRVHMAFIAHGRAVCRAPLPMCSDCSLQDICAYSLQGGARKEGKLAKS